MKIQPSPCCSNAYGARTARWRIPIVIGAAALVIGAGVFGRRGDDAASPFVRESIVVSAEMPRAVATKVFGRSSVQLSDMGDELSLLLVGADGLAVSHNRSAAHARYARGGGVAAPIALEWMNDHLMARVDPAQAGTLTVSLSVDGQEHEVTFDLPLPTK